MQIREYPRTNTYEPTDAMLIDKVNGGTKYLTLGDLVSGDNNPALKAISDAEQTLSTKRHEIGEYLIWENTLYKVTSPIAIGNTLTPGGNIEATTIGAEMSSINNNFFKVWNGNVTITTTLNNNAPGAFKYTGYGEFNCPYMETAKYVTVNVAGANGNSANMGFARRTSMTQILGYSQAAGTFVFTVTVFYK